ncbi:MAG: hypothetical protein D6786_09030 [Gammaproteobacteria bacterium]|nr:MAG: hypothetical protein D6786_09030 [Gammaproteobacteria bacterium]
MTRLDLLLLSSALALLGVLLHPAVRRAHYWRATVTPLASIIGSGFLVVAPLLADIAGSRAVLAMGVVVVLAYAIGAAVRYNIAHAEPLLAESAPPAFLLRAEHLGDLLLGWPTSSPWPSTCGCWPPSFWSPPDSPTARPPRP